MAKTMTPMDTQHRIERDWETAAQIQASRDAILSALKAMMDATLRRDHDALDDAREQAAAAIAEAERD